MTESSVSMSQSSSPSLPSEDACSSHERASKTVNKSEKKKPERRKNISEQTSLDNTSILDDDESYESLEKKILKKKKLNNFDTVETLIKMQEERKMKHMHLEERLLKKIPEQSNI